MSDNSFQEIDFLFQGAWKGIKMLVLFGCVWFCWAIILYESLEYRDGIWEALPFAILTSFAWKKLRK